MGQQREMIRFCLCCAAIALALSGVSCSPTARPPFIKAQVIDVYNRKTDIHNAHLIYWWQERGETAFLDTYERTSRTLRASTVPCSGTDVPVAAAIPLQEISRIDWVLSGSGKKTLVHLRNGDVLEIQWLFPRQLRVDPASGLADYKPFITGSTQDVSGAFDFRQGLDLLQSIIIIGIENG